MNRILSITIFTIFLFIITPINFHQVETKLLNTNNEYVTSDVLGARVINSTKVYVNQPVNLTTIINNPTTWTLKNISFEINLNKEVEVIEALNTSDVITHIEELEEEILVRVNITLIPMNSKGIQWIVIKFTKDGDYDIGESTVSFIKQKGELTEKESITIPTITINVLKPENPYPEEGSRDITIPILLITIIIPLAIIGISQKIAWKE